jgi:hypothetical protein
MALLQPSDVPSMAGINNAITSTVDAHASTTDVNGQHYDSGWIDVVLRTGYVFSGEVPRYRRIGRQVFLRGRVARSPAINFIANNQYIVGDLPANFRPNPLVMWGLAGANGTQSGGRFWVTATGEIIIQPQVDTSNVSLAATFLNN